MSEQNNATCPCPQGETVMLPLTGLGLGVDASALEGLGGGNGIGREEAAQIIESALQEHNGGLAREDAERIITQAVTESGGASQSEILQMITDRLTSQGGITRADLDEMLASAVQSYPKASPESYSFDERWTGGYWIDGKKVYQKTVAISNIFKKTAHGITYLDKVIELYGRTNHGTTYQKPLPYSNMDQRFNIDLVCDQTHLEGRCSDQSGYTGYSSEVYLTVRYTCTNR